MPEYVMKGGTAVPPPLARALERDPYALAVFVKMRQSCQRRYAARILEAKDEDAAKSRAASVIAQIRRYGQKHGIDDML